LNETTHAVFKQALGLHKQKKYGEAEMLYVRILNLDPFDENVLLCLADLYLRKEFNSLAVNLMDAVTRRNPKNGAAWNAMGIGFRKENHIEQALECWGRTLELDGETPEVCNNMAGIYADHGKPHEALAWLDKSLAQRPDSIESNWQRALALLTLKQWDEGWKAYEWRRKLEHWDSRQHVKAPPWDGKPVGHLYIHGEQGVGDEVMFASSIPPMKHLAQKITLEVNAKVADLMKATWPEFDVVTVETPGQYDAKIPIGSLMVMFGMNRTPYLKPDEELVESYRKELKKLGPGPYIAVTWHGGSKQTRVVDRTMRPQCLESLKHYTLVSAQYWDFGQGVKNPYVEEDRKAVGIAKINDESTGTNLHHQAALFAAVDAVVTVQQTAVHVAGGVGAKTWALIGEAPHWRYGTEGNDLPFYSSVKLLRKSGEWADLVKQAAKEIDVHFDNRRIQSPISAVA
jgi:hypothetical protein